MTRETESMDEYIKRIKKENDDFENKRKLKRQTEKDRAVSLFKNKRCSKCNKKVIYIIAYYCWTNIFEFVEGLCREHCPKMSDGSCAYKKLTLIETKKPISSYLKVEEEYNLPTPPDNSCYVCSKEVIQTNEFILQGLKTPLYALEGDVFYKPAVPVDPINYWICKEGYGCADEKRNDW